MAKKEQAVDVPLEGTPLEPGDPVEAPALSQMGGTFAERAKAREAAEKKQVSGASTEDKAVSTRKASKKS